MIKITQNKIAGFEPRWARFPGFSALFDNPGQSTRLAHGLPMIASALARGGPLELYRRLDASLDELDRDRLLNDYLLCPLPPSTYHVTVWDGINPDNVFSLHPDVHPDWKTFLDELPDSLQALPESMALVSESDLLRSSFGSNAFQFESLFVWRNQAFVARLRPARGQSASYRALCEARKALCALARAKLGVNPAFSYSPHVTLGYFANQECGARADAHLEEWNELFRARVQETTISYPSTGLYVFTDMVRFFRLPDR